MTNTITVSVQLKESSQPIIHDGVINTYQKGDIFVVYTDAEKSYKYPIANIWRLVEDYGYHGREVPSSFIADITQPHLGASDVITVKSVQDY